MRPCCAATHVRFTDMQRGLQTDCLQQLAWL